MARTVFDAEVNPLTTPEPINDWVNTKTQGKIKEIVDEIYDETQMWILNAIYFKVRHKHTDLILI